MDDSGKEEGEITDEEDDDVVSVISDHFGDADDAIDDCDYRDMLLEYFEAKNDCSPKKMQSSRLVYRSSAYVSRNNTTSDVEGMILDSGKCNSISPFMLWSIPLCHCPHSRC